MANQTARFEFGENWKRFLTIVDEARILEAEKSLRTLLDVSTLSGKSFLDIGCGSGLFSLAAARLGARVRSFDYDPQSVVCAEELKRRYLPNTPDWTIEQGSVLDEAYMESLGWVDVAYSWGVLHHTGELWRAMENAARRVQVGGLLAIALYNDQGARSKAWKLAKVVYNRLPRPLRAPYAALFFLPLWAPRTVKDALRGRPFHTYKTYASHRGMSPWRDLVDWVGGLPFEVATPEEVQRFCRNRGFELTRFKAEEGYGCNEFAFRKMNEVKAPHSQSGKMKISK